MSAERNPKWEAIGSNIKAAMAAKMLRYPKDLAGRLEKYQEEHPELRFPSSESTVKSWLRGDSRPDDITIAILAEVLGCAPTQLDPDYAAPQPGKTSSGAADNPAVFAPPSPASVRPTSSVLVWSHNRHSEILEKTVLQHFAEQRPANRVSEIIVQEVPRLTTHGSLVCKGRAFVGPRGEHWFFAKLNDDANVLSEYTNWRRFSAARPDSSLVPRATLHEDRHCVVYSSREGDHEEPATLHDLLSDLMAGRIAPDVGWQRAYEIVDRACEILAAEGASDVREWDFSGYHQPPRSFARIDDKSRSMAEHFYTTAEANRVFQNGNLVSPYPVVRTVLTHRTAVKLGVAHGDFHQRNLVYQTAGPLRVWTIDFAWVREMHRLVDFTLLENSLKAMFFARYMSDEDLFRLHERLHAGIEGLARPCDAHTFQDHAFRLLAAVRRRAKKVCVDGGSEKWRTEYYASALLTAWGLVSVASADSFAAWLSAAWFATQVAPFHLHKGPSQR